MVSTWLLVPLTALSLCGTPLGISRRGKRARSTGGCGIKGVGVVRVGVGVGVAGVGGCGRGSGIGAVGVVAPLGISRSGQGGGTPLGTRASRSTCTPRKH